MMERILTVEKATTERYEGGKDLVPLERDVCLLCGGPTHAETIDQGALIRHGGYGATKRTVLFLCDDTECRGVRQSMVTETNPRHG